MTKNPSGNSACARATLLAIAIAATAAIAAGVPAEGAKGPNQDAEIVRWAPMNSRFVDPTAEPEGSYNEPPGVGERPNALRAQVYLPPGYDPDHRYPLLLLLHGQGDAFDSWTNPGNGDLLNTAAGFEGIIVMPEGDRGFYTNWWNGGRRGVPAWERYHLDELLPRIMRRLPIRKARRWHAIAGLSMGGEGAMFYASQRPGFFGSAASFSGPLSIQRLTYQGAFDAGTGRSQEAIWGDPVAQDFYWDGHDPTALVENLAHTRLFVSAGNGVPNPFVPDELTNWFGQLAEAELGQQAAEFAAAAEEAGAPLEYTPHQGIHDWPYWRADLAAAIDWGPFKRPPRPNGDWTFETVAKAGRMWGFRFRFAEHPDEVIVFERDGGALRGSGSGTVTIHGRGTRFTAKLPFERTLTTSNVPG